MDQMTFSLFFQSLINGLNQGAIYALIALGYTMVYGIIRMINFAHGDFIMIGAYTLFYTIPLMVNAGMPAWLSVIVAIAVCALVGVLVETFAYRPVRKAGPMSALITALAMSIFLENLAMVLFGAKPHNVQAIREDYIAASASGINWPGYYDCLATFRQKDEARQGNACRAAG